MPESNNMERGKKVMLEISITLIWYRLNMMLEKITSSLLFLQNF